MKSPFDKLIEFICIFVLSWQSIFRIPDVAVGVFFKFISILLDRLVDVLKLDSMRQISTIFPGTLDKARKMHFINKEGFEKMIVCQQCHCTYPYQLCIDRVGVTENIIKCSFVRFPRHQQTRMSSPCGFPLMKAIKTPSGKRILKPLKVFCYKSIIESIVDLVQQPGMLDLLNHWKLRVVPHGVMADIYDGATYLGFFPLC